ncbi:MAG: beta-N-acetylhexosaminidase, partial [Ginsengibacter sp.]
MHIKRIALALIMFGCVSISNAQEKTKISIIPEPVSMTAGEGSFEVTASTSIEVNGNDSIQKIANEFASKLSAASGLKLPVSGKQNSSSANNKILFTSSTDKTLGTEGYSLTVTPTLVTIASSHAAGAFYAVQTLYQMLPKEINSRTAVTTTKWIIPAATITDYPRFGWRGLMFDVSRHFFTKADVKQFIDQMVPYKYNLLHLHLTDDEGWRIEIKSLPKLTTTGAFRPTRNGKWSNSTNPDPKDPRDYGGFYTQDDIRELVKYASDRFVNILPEIDVPGHSLATVAAYPELSCSNGPHLIFEGKTFMDWPGPIALLDNTLCPANENVYAFLDKVFT